MIRLSEILIAFVLCNLRDSYDSHDRTRFLIQARVCFSSVIRDVNEVMEYEFQSCRVTLTRPRVS